MSPRNDLAMCGLAGDRCPLSSRCLRHPDSGTSVGDAQVWFAPEETGRDCAYFESAEFFAADVALHMPRGPVQRRKGTLRVVGSGDADE